MKRGDLVRYEYLTRDAGGVGWEFHKGIGVVIDYNTTTDSYRILARGGTVIERLDMQLEIVGEKEAGAPP